MDLISKFRKRKTEFCDFEYYNILKNKTFQYSEKFDESLAQIFQLWNQYKIVLKKSFRNKDEFFEEIAGKSYNLGIDNRVIIPDLMKMAEIYSVAFCPDIDFSSNKDLGTRAFLQKDIIHLIFNIMNSSVPLCTQGKGLQSLAGFQDAADPFTHYIFICSEEEKDWNPIHQIQMVECKARNLKTKDEKSYILVEGVYGSPNNRSELYVYQKYALKIIFEFTNKLNQKNEVKRGVLINKSYHCSNSSQIEPIEFVNGVYEWLYGKEKPLYVLPIFSETFCLYKGDDKTEGEDKANYYIEPSSVENDETVMRKLKNLLGKEGIFRDVEGMLAAYSKDLRYLDTTCKKDNKRKNKGRIADKDNIERHITIAGGWNNRKGETLVIPFESEEVEMIYRSLL